MELEGQQLAWDVGRWVARGLLVLAAVTFIIQWLLPKVRKVYRLQFQQTQYTSHQGDSSARSSFDLQRQETLRQELHEKHQAKAAIYKDRILLPRQEAKKRQKEEEFYRFMGPAWKGHGEVLGVDKSQRDENKELDEFEGDLNPSEMAAIRRRIQKPTPQPPKPQQKPKRVVVLPDEPDNTDTDSVLVLLRSPIQTVYQRRFRHSHTVQSLLDFMTMSGFSQTFNTLCTSYPRHDLSKDRDCTLLDLGFKGRVTLNIEEKDL